MPMASTITPELAAVIWHLIDRLPDNLHEYTRDTKDLANLLVTCGIDIERLSGPDASIVVK